MSETRAAVSVILVDDHAVVREGYRRLLERTDDISVIAEVATG
jgi:DNA-binding NarL/FixJ family response regulator